LDERFTPRPRAGWFIPAAIASLLFMGLGCVALVMHVTADPSKLPLDERTLFQAEPQWVLAASAFTFVAGALGALLLVLRNKAAERALLVSLIGMVVWFAGMFATPAFRDLLSTNEIAVLLIVFALSWTIYWFARHSRQRGWLH
jgi:hypothetical protein